MYHNNMIVFMHILMWFLWQFIIYGEVVVKACIKEGADYVDITGEEYVCA